jgi:xanthine/CO dehydrogenase XdhC/CoxF family maturation factor
MKELKDIIRAHEEAEREGKRSALATVVHLEGSAYRRPGARMLVTEDGKLTGAISGGCLEGDALRKAQLVIVQKNPMLVTYDTTDDDDAKLGVGLGCNGIISILIEPVNADDENNPINLLKTVLSKRESAVLVTLFSLERKTAQTGTCIVIAESGVLKNSLPETVLRETLVQDAMIVLKTGMSITKMYTAEIPVTAFIELIIPSISLVAFGAGNDVIPLVEMAKILGWETTVVDGRPNYATQQRFPAANKILISKAEEALNQIIFDKRTVAVLMSHNYNYDIAALRALLPLESEYIGMLGPKKKLKRMLDELKEEGMEINDKTVANVFGPTGLDLGAETAEEIALSIISEIKAVLSKRNGSPLRDKEETIHSRETQTIISTSSIKER